MATVRSGVASCQKVTNARKMHGKHTRAFDVGKLNNDLGRYEHDEE